MGGERAEGAEGNLARIKPPSPSSVPSSRRTARHQRSTGSDDQAHQDHTLMSLSRCGRSGSGGRARELMADPEGELTHRVPSPGRAPTRATTASSRRDTHLIRAERVYGTASRLRFPREGRDRPDGSRSLGGGRCGSDAGTRPRIQPASSPVSNVDPTTSLLPFDLILQRPPHRSHHNTSYRLVMAKSKNGGSGGSKARKTRAFGAVKRMINPADPRLSVQRPAKHRVHCHVADSLV